MKEDILDMLNKYYDAYKEAPYICELISIS